MELAFEARVIHSIEGLYCELRNVQVPSARCSPGAAATASRQWCRLSPHLLSRLSLQAPVDPASAGKGQGEVGRDPDPKTLVAAFL